ncbi:hypothetical protein ALC57_07476 [Trachymyrmex cornetzi]|uniref:TIL domain-containing protein n=1 Tax=Trachymyrmex cornetzi TaxID=471704 RepID=A0A195E524_9HYME|nr:hypothetical protein ALC57_07476 [Trachymyrmex cornetzi]
MNLDFRPFFRNATKYQVFIAYINQEDITEEDNQCMIGCQCRTGYLLNSLGECVLPLNCWKA